MHDWSSPAEARASCKKHIILCTSIYLRQLSVIPCQRKLTGSLPRSVAPDLDRTTMFPLPIRMRERGVEWMNPWKSAEVGPLLPPNHKTGCYPAIKKQMSLKIAARLQSRVHIETMHMSNSIIWLLYFQSRPYRYNIARR